MRAVLVLALLCRTASADPWWFDGGPVVGFPRGDLVQEGRSTGLALLLGRQLMPEVSLVMGYRKLWIPTSRVWDGEAYSLHNIQWILGLRFAHRVVGPVALFSDVEGHFERFKIDESDFASSDESPHDGLGVAIRIGAFVHLDASVVVGASLGASLGHIDLYENNLGPSFHSPFADNWLTADAFVGVQL